MTYDDFVEQLDQELLEEKIEALRQPSNQPQDTSDENFIAGLIVLREEVEGEANSQLLQQASMGMDTSITVQKRVDDDQKEIRNEVVENYLAQCEEEMSAPQYKKLYNGLSTWTW